MGKVISVFTKSFKEMPLPAHRYKKVISKGDGAKNARATKCYAMVQFPDRGKAYTYVCDLPEVKVGDNDPNMAAYILKKTLNQFGAQTEVVPIAPSLEKLNKEALAIYLRDGSYLGWLDGEMFTSTSGF